MAGDATDGSATCVHCGSPLPANTPFCAACGRAVTGRQIALAPQDDASPPAAIVGVDRGVRCTAYALDLAVLASPALSLAMTAGLLHVAAVVYVVTPVTFVAGWIWMTIWQGLTGMSFGKAMLGLRAIRATDPLPPGFSASLLRSVLFAGTAGLAALPVLADPGPRDGWHDRLSGITVIDISVGDNPLGPRQLTALRTQIDRGLKKVRSPVPIGQHISVGRA